MPVVEQILNVDGFQTPLEQVEIVEPVAVPVVHRNVAVVPDGKGAKIAPLEKLTVPPIGVTIAEGQEVPVPVPDPEHVPNWVHWPLLQEAVDKPNTPYEYLCLSHLEQILRSRSMSRWCWM